MAKRVIQIGPAPTVKLYDIRDMTDRLEPGRSLPTAAYRFGDGREFIEQPGEWYDDVEVPE